MAPARIETTGIPGNIDQITAPVLVTFHSFTPIFHGNLRDDEIGVLLDRDSRLADALLAVSYEHLHQCLRRNEPYDPEYGVTHTLKDHALADEHLNFMLEIKNDPIADGPAQNEMATNLSTWVTQTLEIIGVGP